MNKRECTSFQEFYQCGLGEADYPQKIQCFLAAEKFLKELCEPPVADVINLYLQMADCYFQVKDFDAAIAVSQKIIQLDSERADGFFLLANGYFAKEMYSQALKAYVIAMQIDFENPVYHYHAGLTLSHLEEYQYAIISFDKAIEKDPDNAEYYFCRGYSYHQLIEKTENKKENIFHAEQDYSHAIAIQPSHAGYYYHRAHFWRDIEQYEPAIIDFTRALELPFENLDAIYRERAWAYSRLNRYTEALEDYQRVLSVHPDWEQPLYERGVVYFHLKRYSDCISDMQKVIEIFHENAYAHYYSGLAYFYRGKRQKALEHLNFAEELGVNEAYLAIHDINNGKKPSLESYCEGKILIKSVEEESEYIAKRVCPDCGAVKKYETGRIFYVNINQVPLDIAAAQCMVCGNTQIFTFDISLLTNTSFIGQ